MSSGRLLASGRDADIFEHGTHSVLRRSRRARSLAGEAQLMELARSAGYPVPAVEAVSPDGRELVMERIEGPSMMTALGAQPWKMAAIADQLARLHQDLHAIAAPDWVPAAGVGPVPPAGRRQLLHLDLHPQNVLLSPRGPMVIDWARASAGVGEIDVDATWVILAAAGIPAGRVRAAVMGPLRSIFVRRFLSHFDQAGLRAHLAEVVAWKSADPNMTPAECAAMGKMVGGPPGPGRTDGRATTA